MMTMEEKKIAKVTIWSRTFVLMMVCSMCMSLSQFIVNPLISTYAAFLGAGSALVGLLTGLYYGVSVLLRPFSGPAIVFLDKKKVLLFSYGMGLIVNACYAAFSSIPMFIVARALHGVQFSLMGSIAITIAGDSLPKEKMGSGLGIYSLGGAIATAIGPAVGITLRSWGESRFGEAGGFKSMFYAAVIFSAIATIPCLFIQPKKHSKEEIAASGAWYKNIVAAPSVPSATCNLFFAMAYSLFSAYMIPYAAERGFSGISVFFTIYAVGLLVSRPASGKLTDRFGAVTVLYLAGVIFALAFVVLWRASSIGWVYFSAVLAALGYGGANPAFHTICLQSMPGARRGVASNTNFFGIDSGQFLGPTIGGFVISRLINTGHAYSLMYLLCGTIPLALALLVLTLSKDYIVKRLADVAEKDN